MDKTERPVAPVLPTSETEAALTGLTIKQYRVAKITIQFLAMAQEEDTEIVTRALEIAKLLHEARDHHPMCADYLNGKHDLAKLLKACDELATLPSRVDPFVGTEHREDH